MLSGGTVKKGISEYINNLKHILIPYYKLWGPIMFVILYWVPINFRIACIGVTALIWCIMLSFLSPMIEN